jgi:hypothetical protein
MWPVMKKLNDTKPTMHQLFAITSEWEKDRHVKKGIIFFQNKETLSVVKFTTDSFHTVSKNPRGVENLPECVEHPDEIWSFWDDPKKQIVTMRNYILIGSNISYICQTKDGVIQNAFGVTASQVNKYRKGLILLK